MNEPIPVSDNRKQCRFCGRKFKATSRFYKFRPDWFCLKCFSPIEFSIRKYIRKCTVCQEVFLSSAGNIIKCLICSGKYNPLPESEYEPISEPKCESISESELELKSAYQQGVPIMFRIPPKPSTHYLKDRYNLLVQSKFTCKACGRSRQNYPTLELHIDHILPRSKGGEDTSENRTVLCQECNIGKGNRISPNDILLTMNIQKNNSQNGV